MGKPSASSSPTWCPETCSKYACWGDQWHMPPHACVCEERTLCPPLTPTSCMRAGGGHLTLALTSCVHACEQEERILQQRLAMNALDKMAGGGDAVMAGDLNWNDVKDGPLHLLPGEA